VAFKSWRSLGALLKTRRNIFCAMRFRGLQVHQAPEGAEQQYILAYTAATMQLHMALSKPYMTSTDARASSNTTTPTCKSSRSESCRATFLVALIDITTDMYKIAAAALHTSTPPHP
jgi:hypothetical protein